MGPYPPATLPPIWGDPFGYSRDMSWEKRKDELREETARTARKKKKTARWCRGKVGVEHVTEVVRNHNYSPERVCKWWPVYRSYARRDEGPKEYRYSCLHSLKCTSCGKYTEYFLGPEQCPDVVPKPVVSGP